VSWFSPSPLERWEKRDIFVFLREVFTRHRTFGTFTWDPPSVGANTTVDATVTDDALTGLRAGQPVYVTPPSTLDAGLVCGGAWVAADDSITIRLGNVTASPINPASGTWAFQGVIP
jgi:hypothetical protein